jgi:teichuronic acid biosynthesis glycosyltransferase TuaC
MKVLVFTSLYPNNIWKYHGVFIKERMTNFARMNGCEIKVVAPTPYFPALKINHQWWSYSQIVKREVIDGAEVYHPRYFMIPRVSMFFQGLSIFAATYFLVRRIQKDFDFDIIDAHYVYPDGFAAVLLGQLLGKPVVVSARGTDINLYPRFVLIRKFLRYTLRKCSHAIAVCQALKDAMVRLGVPDQKVTVIPNGVDHTNFRPLPRKQAREDLQFPLERRVILSVGLLIPRKGFDILIKATKILVEKYGYSDLLLIVVGEGESRRHLEKLTEHLGLQEHVRLAGAVAHENLYKWYSAADLFCLASSREGWPNVVLEALACGRPVVATSVWGTPEIIRSDRIGLLTVQEERAMAEQLDRAFKMSWQEKEIVQHARERTWGKVAEAVHRVFHAALSGQNISR